MRERERETEWDRELWWESKKYFFFGDFLRPLFLHLSCSCSSCSSFSSSSSSSFSSEGLDAWLRGRSRQAHRNSHPAHWPTAGNETYGRKWDLRNNYSGLRRSYHLLPHGTTVTNSEPICMSPYVTWQACWLSWRGSLTHDPMGHVTSGLLWH